MDSSKDGDGVNLFRSRPNPDLESNHQGRFEVFDGITVPRRRVEDP